MQDRTFEETKEFLRSASGLRMAHIYKPVMLLTIIRNGGTASKNDIAKAFLLRDSSQIDFYKRNVHKMPGTRLVRDGFLEKDGNDYSLIGILGDLSQDQRIEIEEILEQRISNYLEMRNPFDDSNLDSVPGSVRFNVLLESGNRCELCGVSSQQKQIDVDHIVPRSKGGSNDRSNLQALCRTCNAQKKNRDDTDFHAVHESYSDRDKDCVFCQIEDTKERIIDGLENELAFAVYDGYPVTSGHTLVIPKRHVGDYFDLYQSERNALEELIRKQKGLLSEQDPAITGWNIGVNAGSSAGQTIFHVHMHLIPRRDGDMDEPRGGVRGVIPEKQSY